MVSSSHLNLLIWLQEADNDVWLYLYKNYFVPILYNREVVKQIPKPLQFKRMYNNYVKESGSYRGIPQHESRCYLNYVAGKYRINPHDQRFDANQCQKFYLAGNEMYSPTASKPGWAERRNIPDISAHNISKEKLMESCEELDIHYRPSWTKTKLVRTMLNHEDNCYDDDYLSG